MKKIGIKLLHDDEAEGSIKIAPGFTDNSIIFQLDSLQDCFLDLRFSFSSSYCVLHFTFSTNPYLRKSGKQYAL